MAKNKMPVVGDGYRQSLEYLESQLEKMSVSRDEFIKVTNATHGAYESGQAKFFIASCQAIKRIVENYKQKFGRELGL